jgi:hypothetical protein
MLIPPYSFRLVSFGQKISSFVLGPTSDWWPFTSLKSLSLIPGGVLGILIIVCYHLLVLSIIAFIGAPTCRPLG